MKPVYHITHYRNLESIIACGSLFCDSIRAERGLDQIGIAHQHIKERRKRKRVPIGPQGVLADYVPFYFAPRSPMLYAINRGAVEGYEGGQAPVVHLVGDIDRVVANGGSFVFTDGHAEMDISDYFEDLDDTDKLDWEIMRARFWNDTMADGDRKRRRQAEFLVHSHFPWEWVVEIGVMNPEIAECVADSIPQQAWTPPIKVHRDWYY